MQKSLTNLSKVRDKSLNYKYSLLKRYSIMTKKSEKFDIFLSHASEDKNTVAFPLYYYLSQFGYKVWYDESELKGGDDLYEKIIQAISQSKLCVFILSPSFFNRTKKWTTEELVMVRSQLDNKGNRFIPIFYNITYNEIPELYSWIIDKRAIQFKDGIENVLLEISKIAKSSTLKLDYIADKESLNKMYYNVCESNFKFEEYCYELTYHDSFKLDSIYSLKNELKNKEISEIQVVRIMNNLSNILLQKHIPKLYIISLILFEYIPFTDDFYKFLFKRGLSDFDILDNFSYMPNNANFFLCRQFTKAIEKLEENYFPYSFYRACVNSESFVHYMLKYEIKFLYEIIRRWLKECEKQIGDVLVLIAYIYNFEKNDDTKYRLEKIVYDVCKNGQIEKHIVINSSSYNEVIVLVENFESRFKRQYLKFN